MFIYIKISNNLQFLALATVYGHLATVYYLLQKRAPTVNQIVQNGCLQFISFLGHYFTPGYLMYQSVAIVSGVIQCYFRKYYQWL